MANRPADAGAHSAGPHQGPPAAPPPVHHQDFPRAPGTAEPAPARPASAGIKVVAWLPYLIALAGAVAGLFVTWQGSQRAGRGTAVVGGALLVAAVARLAAAAALRRAAGVAREGSGRGGLRGARYRGARGRAIAAMSSS